MSTPSRSVPYYEEDYFRHNLAKGTLFNRAGTKMCMMPSEMLSGLQEVLEEETGDAWADILRKVGRIWGRRVARRFQKEMSEYYARPLHELPMRELVQLLEAFFRYHGWGDLRLDFSHSHHGFIAATLANSAMVEIIGKRNRPVDGVVCGLLSEFFCQLSERADLDCIETECATMGRPVCKFILGLSGRLAPVEGLLQGGLLHEEILATLCPEKEVTDEPAESDTQPVRAGSLRLV